MNSGKELVRNVVLNTSGTFVYFFCQWLITVLVVRLSGYEDAGVLSLVISTTNVFSSIALFGLRNYQVSDIKIKYSDSNYIVFRLITILISLIAFIICLFFLKFDTKVLACSLIYILYKFAEALTDVFFGIYQRYSSYKAIAISYTLKGVLTVVTFILGLMITRSLFVALLLNVLTYVVILLLYDRRILKVCFQFHFLKFNYVPLLITCFPLMLYNCMIPILNFITRFAVEYKYGISTLGYYSSITLVLVVMSTLMSSVFVSVIPRVTLFYHEKNILSLKKVIRSLLIIIIIFAFIACIVAYLLGDFVFKILFGEGILDYTYLLVPTIITSIALTLASLFSTILISFGENKKVLYFNFVAIVICSVSIMFFINKFSLIGSLYCLFTSLSVSVILLFILILKKVKSLHIRK